MLREFDVVRQEPGDLRRRWFGDDFFDLIVWYGESGSVMGFQLCYDKDDNERALTWMKDGGYNHDRIDASSKTRMIAPIPILMADGAFDRDEIKRKFRENSVGIDPEVATLVLSRLEGFRK